MLPNTGLAQGRISVGPNVAVSAPQATWEHSEYVADADVSDASRVMVCSMKFSQPRNQLTTAIYTTVDGGRTWFLSLDDSSSRLHGVWDLACTYGVDGQAFFATVFTARRRVAVNQP
jgi:hypothetical protein